MNRRFIVLLILLLTVIVATVILIRNYNPARRSEQQERDIFKKNQEIQSLIGQAYFEINSNAVDNAERLLYRVLDLDENNQAALNLLGQIMMKKNRFFRAEQICRQLIAIDPQNPVYYNNLSLILIRENCLNEAEAYLKKSIEIDANSIIPHIKLAEIYIKNGKKKSAIEELSTAFKIRKEFEKITIDAELLNEIKNEAEFQKLFTPATASENPYPAEEKGINP